MPRIKNALLRYRIIDKCIRNKYKPFPTKDQLRRACEEALFGSSHGENISDSTIEKDLFAMRMEHDAPLKYSKREKGYFYEDPEFTMDEIPLNEDDVDAIKFAANVFYQFKGVEVFRKFEFAIDKILDRVNISDKFTDKSIEKFVQFETAPIYGGSEFLSEILDGIKRQRSIQFEYEKFDGTDKKLRRVDPYLLKEYRNRWYMIGKTLVKGKTQTFGLDRMSNLVVLNEKFDRDKSFDPDVYFKHAIGITTNSDMPEKVVIEANSILSNYLISQPIHASQELVKEKKKWMRFQYDVLINNELIMLLLSYGPQVRVLEPQSLKDELSNRMTEALGHYVS